MRTLKRMTGTTTGRRGRPAGRFRAFAVAAALLLTAAWTLTSLSAEKPPAANTMTVYSGLVEREADAIIKAFEKETGAKVKVVSIKTGELAHRLEQEKASPAASAVFGGSLPVYITAKNKGLLEPWKPAGVKGYDRKFVDPDGDWVGIYVGIIGFCSSRGAKVKPPKSWDDLLKPEYKGKIVLSSPLTSGTAYTYVATLVQLMGEEKAFDYLEKLDRQTLKYTDSGSKPCAMVKDGAAGVGLSFAHDIILLDPKGAKMEISFPREGTGIEVGGAAVVKNAPNRALARKFIDFLTGPKIQSQYGKGVFPPRFPTNPKVPPPSNAFTVSGLKLIQFNLEWSGENEERLKTRWKKQFGARAGG